MFPGRIIANRYRVLRVLGRGGMGVVSEAEAIATGEHFAIKFLREDVESEMAPSARFLREAKLAARLTSPHTCRMTEIGEWELGPFLVMELLQGRTLAAVLEDKLTISWQQCVRIAWEMCDALAEAHQRGIVHRDIKASNVFLASSSDQHVTTKVLDFGVAKIPNSVVTACGERSLTDASTMLGTPSYVAPEQLMNSKLVDARADVWSTGVLMYEMLSGRLPFVSPLVPKLLVMIAREVPAPLAGLAPSAPPELVKIVHRCLEKDPQRRYEHAGELAAALMPFLDAGSELLQPLMMPRPQSFSLCPTQPPPSAETRATPSKARDRDSLNPHTARTPDLQQQSRRRSRLGYVAAGSGIGALSAVVYLLASGAPSKGEPAGSASAGAAAATAAPNQPVAHQILVLVDPTQARIMLDGTAVAGTPSRILRADDGKPHTLNVSAPGYGSVERLVRFNVDQQLTLSLAQLEAPPPASVPTHVTERPPIGPKRASSGTKGVPNPPKGAAPRHLDTDNPF